MNKRVVVLLAVGGLAAIAAIAASHGPIAAAVAGALPPAGSEGAHAWYFRFWRTGLALGSTAALWVLARRRCANARAVACLGLAMLAFLYGAKVQSRLLTMPVLEALLVSPHELLEPGYRLPLALLLLFAVGLAASVALRTSWLAMGDALALLVPVTESVGRLGCLLNGCCFGTPTDLPWGVTYPRSSDAHALHVAMDWLAPSAGASLPVHPLAVYYAVASVLLVALMVGLVVRGAPAGSLLLTALLLEPPIRLGLEHLRATFPWTDWTPMITTLTVWTVLDVILVAVRFWPEHARHAAVPATARPTTASVP